MVLTKTSAARLSIFSNSFLILLKFVIGLMTGSVSIIAEAVHSMNDLVAAFIAYFSVRVSDKPADSGHPFGHGKVENVSGTVEAILIFIAAIAIIYEAWRKMLKGVTIELTELGIGVMFISVVTNIVVSRILYKVAKDTDSLALEADARHLSADVYTSLGVMAGLIALKITDLHILDPIVAIGVALFITKTAWTITRKSFGGLVDEKLPPEEEATIESSIMEHVQDVVGFHNLRTRKAGSHRYVDLHLVMDKEVSLEQAHQMCDHLEKDIRSRLPNTNIIIHCEPCDARRCGECEFQECTRYQKTAVRT